MNREESNKIIVTEDMEVGSLNGETIEASLLACWAYRRLEMWPKLLEACRDMVFLEKTAMTRRQVRSQIARCKDILDTIDKS